jgi:hypothetical protein
MSLGEWGYTGWAYMYLATGANAANNGVMLHPSGAAHQLEQRNSTNAQTFRIYGTYTDASNYRRLFLSSTTAGAFTLGVEGAGTGASGNTLTVNATKYNASGTVPYTSVNHYADLYLDRVISGRGLTREADQIAFAGLGGTAETAVRIYNGNLTIGASTLTGSSATSALDIAQTWNTTGTPTLIKANVTDTASNASSLLMDLQVGGTSRFNIAKSGRVIINNGDLLVQSASASPFVLTGGLSGVAGRARLGHASNTDGELSLARIALSSNFGAVRGDTFLQSDTSDTLAQRNSTNAQTFRIYNTFTDSSNYERGKLEWASNVLRIGTEKAGTGSARALELQTDGTTRLTIGTAGLFTIADALNIEVGTTTGTKIGTATTQKLGFWNATPVVQPTAVADATDAASVITQLNALLSRMRTLGLIAT